MTTKDKMLRTLSRCQMLSPGDTVAVGCSGGADSMCLLSLLYECSGELRISVRAVHVNHGIRGAEADADEQFVRDFCEERAIPLSVYRADVPRLAAETGESMELCARNVRYGFFAREKADKIATAHTATDAAETMLMHLARGSGLHGLCGIPPVRGKIIRPLIECFRDETEAYCAAAGIGYVTDSTNALDDCTRNRLRHGAIPAIKQVFPSFEQNALRSATLLRDDEAFLNSAAEACYAQVFDKEANALACGRLLEAAPAVRRRVLKKFLAAQGADAAEARHILLLEARLADARFSLTLPGAYAAQIANGTLRVLPAGGAAEPELPAEEEIAIAKENGGTFTFGGYSLEFTVRPWEKNAGYEKIHAFAVDFSKIDAIINLRTKRPGDRISLAARGCSKSLKKLMNELKIPAALRACMPVLADEHGVIFTPCAGVDASRLPGENTTRVLVIRAFPQNDGNA